MTLMLVEANQYTSDRAKLIETRTVFLELLSTRDCVINGKVEIAEELSAQFDIGLDLARRIINVLDEAK